MKEQRMMLSLLVFSILAYLTMDASHSVWMVIGSVLVLNLSFSLVSPLFSQLEHKIVQNRCRATVMSACAILADMVAALVDLGIGKIMDWNLDLGMMTCGLLVLLSLDFYCLYQNRKY